MFYAIAMLVVGAGLVFAGFKLMQPKNDDIPVGGGGYVDLGPQERSQKTREAGKIMLGIGIVLAAGGLVWIVSRMLIAMLGVILVAALIALVIRLFRF